MSAAATAIQERGPVDVSWVESHDWRMLIGGRLVEAAGGRRYESISPTTAEAICTIPDGDERDVEAAVRSGREAAPGWRATHVRERAAVLHEVAARVREHASELAALDAVDSGNAYSLMLDDVELGAQGIELMAGMASLLRGETIPATADSLHYTLREPFGVVGRITPFNHPVMFAAQKIAAPLIAGNAVVLKPADTAALSALRIGELAADLLPPGTLNLVVGDGPTVPRALVRHPEVRRIGFTGSAATGRAVQRDAAEVGVKDVSLELGGKNAMIVCPDVDLDRTAEAVIKGMNFRGWQSQSCSSTSRLLVHEEIAEPLLERVAALVGKLRVGDPLDPSVEMGPLANRAQCDKVRGYIEIGRDEGARLLVGGGRPEGVDERGFFVEPTVFADVDPGMRIANEEIFGPVLSAMTWTEEVKAVELANAVEYGLTGAIWTNDVSRAHSLAAAMEAGYVWINSAATHHWAMPFGGVKNSGVGREEGLDELLSYTTIKAVNTDLGG